MSADDYSATEAAKLLGLSPKRIRQLAAAGTLSVVQDSPLRVSAESVIAERNRRGVSPIGDTAADTEALALLRAALDEGTRQREVIERLYTERLAITDRRLADLESALADARARAEAAEAQIVILQNPQATVVDSGSAAEQTGTMAASRKRRWYHRGDN